MSILTLTTDFGTRDGFIGMMKGVILGICPDVRLVDISHHIHPQNVREGAFVLKRAFRYFPAGTVHVVVVDPGVGTARDAIAAQVGTYFFVAPDNGLLWELMEEAAARGETVQAVRLDDPDYWRPGAVSHTFHGRDIFAPVGAHLAAGVPLKELGTSLQREDLVRLARWQPRPLPSGWEAHIQYIDHFGNCFTDLSAEDVYEKNIRISIKGHTIAGITRAYGEAHPGALVSVINSENWLELAVVNGSAAEKLNAKIGDSLLVETL